MNKTELLAIGYGTPSEIMPSLFSLMEFRKALCLYMLSNEFDEIEQANSLLKSVNHKIRLLTNTEILINDDDKGANN